MFLIVGGDSEIGAAAFRAIKARGHAVAATTRRRDRTAADRPFLDLAAALDDWQPPPGTVSACLCAAVARLAACAFDPEASARVNVTQTLALIDRLVARGIHVLFLSTNQVFDGRVPYVAADAPHSPVSEYGRQKASVETALRARMARGAPAAILRLAKVVPARMPLIDGWIADLSAGRAIRAFGDMKLAPTPIDLVCEAIARLLEDRATGIFQLTGPRDVTYAELGRFLAAHVGADRALVQETSALDSGLPAGATPHNTTLDSGPLCARYGLVVPDVWEVAARLVSAPDRNRDRAIQDVR
jgi:dTDP-4-dehydrorhamnose reductase